MPTHITVNGLGLTHKSSTGFSKATIPDVCKTPSPGGPVPLPYPNFAMSSTLQNGTTTVFAKGGAMIANKGSQYGMSTGDEPGTVGGVKSNTFKQATDWILYSFNVKMDGKNACRHTDKKYHNNKNTVDLQGNANPAPLPTVVFDSATFPNKVANMKKRMGPGKKKLTRQTSRSAIRKNRRAALKGEKKGKKNTSLDEFPFASSTQGGKPPGKPKAAVAAIPVSEQNAQGGKLSSFYQNNGIGDGDSYWVEIT